MQQQSQLGILAMILGIVGLLMTFMGCSVPPVLMLGAILCVAAIIMGFMEKQKIATGESSDQGAQMALVGQVTGGLGCVIQLLMGLVILVGVVLYIALIAFAIIVEGL